MKDKYNSIIKSYSINDNVKNRILNRVNKNYRFKFAYVMSFILIVFSIMSVSAYELIKKWGGVERTTKNGIKVFEGEREIVKTNVDDMVVNDDYIASELMTINDIEKFLGVDLLSISDEYKDSPKNSEYVLSKYMNNSNKVQTIYVKELGKLKDGKTISLNAHMITKNFPLKYIESYNYDTGYDYKDLTYVDTISLDNLNVNGIVYTQTYIKNEKKYEKYHIEFSYNNIKYILAASEKVELVNLLKILNTLK